MGNSEQTKSVKSEKSSSPTPDQNNVSNSTGIHAYPDWAAMQAYYGPRVTVPPYYNSAVASGHAPHPYMWCPPQHMIPPYGTPYPAIYPHGGVYAHPAVSVGPHSHGLGVPSSPATAVTPLNIETPLKGSGNTSQGLMKKLKGFDGLAMSIGNISTDSADGGVEHGLSESVETEGSSDGSDGTSAGAKSMKRKRSREGTPTTGKDAKLKTRAIPIPTSDMSEGSSKLLATPKSSADTTGKLIGSVISRGMSTALELRNPSCMNAIASPTGAPQPCQVIPPETWLQNEKELKRERRKQSNRESARRSRLRKQAETEELARKVDSLTAENVAIRSEINRLSENSEKLKQENATLMEKLKTGQSGRTEALDINEKRMQPVSTEILGPVKKSINDEGNVCKKNSSSGAKLRQLLDASPRADAVAAS